MTIITRWTIILWARFTEYSYCRFLLSRKKSWSTINGQKHGSNFHIKRIQNETDVSVSNILMDMNIHWIDSMLLWDGKHRESSEKGMHTDMISYVCTVKTSGSINFQFAKWEITLTEYRFYEQFALCYSEFSLFLDIPYICIRILWSLYILRINF